MKSKKAISLLLALLLTALCACGQTSPQPQPSSQPTSQPSSQSQPEEPPPAPEEPPQPEPPAQTKSEYPTTMTQLCPEGFDYAEEFHNGYAFAIRGMDCGYVDKTGNFTVCYQIDQTIWNEWFDNSCLVAYNLSSGPSSACFPVSDEGLYPFLVMDGSTDSSLYRGHWGYKNIHTGEVVIEPQYGMPAPFRDGRAVVAVKTPKEPVTSSSSGSSTVYADGWRANAGQGSNTGSTYDYYVIDAAGKVIFHPHGVQEGFYSNGMLHVSGGGTSHFMVDRDGNMIADLGPSNGLGGGPSLYHDSVALFGGGCRSSSYDPEHILTWTSGGDIFYINSKGEHTAVPPAEAVDASTFCGGISGYKTADKKWGLWNTSGEVLTPPVFIDFGSFFGNGDPSTLAEEDYTWAAEEGTPNMFGQMQHTSCYVINNKGQRVGDEIYENLGTYAEGLMAAQKDGKWGFITPGDGNIVIDFVYDAAGKFSEGVTTVEKDGERYFINKKGERLEGVTSQSYFTCEEGTYLIFKDGKYNFAIAS